MTFDTPMGTYVSEEYSLREHLNHYLIFFVKNPIKIKAGMDIGFAFGNEDGSMVFFPQEILSQSVFSFELINSIMGHYHKITAKINDGLSESEEEFLRVIADAYWDAYVSAVEIARQNNVEYDHLLSMLSNIKKLMLAIGYEFEEESEA